MLLTNIVSGVNAKLAGEILTYSQLKVHLDSVIDDINARLNSTFPSFTDFNSSDYSSYPNYNFFPERYIRNVLLVGAAYKFYITDEEGAQSALTYQAEYQNALFIMQRDYSNSIPTEFQADYQGYLLAEASEDSYDPDNPSLSDIFPNLRYVESTASGSSWNGRHLTLGEYHLWFDSDNNFRVKLGAPTSETDGEVLNAIDTNDLADRTTVNETDIDSLQDLTAGHSATLTSLNNTDIGLDTRLDTAEGDIGNLQSDMVTHTHDGRYYTETEVNTMFAENKVKFTAEKGLAIKLINKTGVASVKGSIVSASTGADESFILQTNEFDSIGVVYEDGITDGNECWVVVSGVAQVLLKDGTAATRGNWVIAADTDGRADATQPTPSPNNTTNEHTVHFKEIGHCLETKNSGTNVLAKCIIHFN